MQIYMIKFVIDFGQVSEFLKAIFLYKSLMFSIFLLNSASGTW
jgi:hypothetical protein